MAEVAKEQLGDSAKGIQFHQVNQQKTDDMGEFVESGTQTYGF